MSLTEELQLKDGDICSIVGAGGKTSLLYALTKENHLGKTLATTTTMMHHPGIGRHPFKSLQIAPRTGWPYHKETPTCLIASTLISGQINKIRGFFPEEIDNWQNEKWPLTLIEADGASERALKMPADHEPQIPLSTSVTIGVIGLDILGEKASSTTVHRFPLAQKRIGLKEGESISLNHLIQIINHPEGLFKRTPPGSRRVLILNKSDTLRKRSSRIPSMEEIGRTFPAQCCNTGMILVTELLDYSNPIYINLNRTRSLHVPI